MQDDPFGFIPGSDGKALEMEYVALKNEAKQGPPKPSAKPMASAKREAIQDKAMQATESNKRAKTSAPHDNAERFPERRQALPESTDRAGNTERNREDKTPCLQFMKQVGQLEKQLEDAEAAAISRQVQTFLHHVDGRVTSLQRELTNLCSYAADHMKSAATHIDSIRRLLDSFDVGTLP